jgi:hypothetical protein
MSQLLALKNVADRRRYLTFAVAAERSLPFLKAPSRTTSTPTRS